VVVTVTTTVIHMNRSPLVQFVQIFLLTKFKIYCFLHPPRFYCSKLLCMKQ